MGNLLNFYTTHLRIQFGIDTNNQKIDNMARRLKYNEDTYM